MQTKSTSTIAASHAAHSTVATWTDEYARQDEHKWWRAFLRCHKHTISKWTLSTSVAIASSTAHEMVPIKVTSNLSWIYQHTSDGGSCVCAKYLVESINLLLLSQTGCMCVLSGRPQDTQRSVPNLGLLHFRQKSRKQSCDHLC